METVLFDMEQLNLLTWHQKLKCLKKWVGQQQKNKTKQNKKTTRVARETINKIR